MSDAAKAGRTVRGSGRAPGPRPQRSTSDRQTQSETQTERRRTVVCGCGAPRPTWSRLIASAQHVLQACVRPRHCDRGRVGCLPKASGSAASPTSLPPTSGLARAAQPEHAPCVQRCLIGWWESGSFVSTMVFACTIVCCGLLRSAASASLRQAACGKHAARCPATLCGVPRRAYVIKPSFRVQ
jgi:hypothetical protein